MSKVARVGKKEESKCQTKHTVDRLNPQLSASFLPPLILPDFGFDFPGLIDCIRLYSKLEVATSSISD
jgi:hypothetical protein